MINGPPQPVGQAATYFLTSNCEVLLTDNLDYFWGNHDVCQPILNRCIIPLNEGLKETS